LAITTLQAKRMHIGHGRVAADALKVLEHKQKLGVYRRDSGPVGDYFDGR
jgi:hypothetical protein